MKVDREHLIGVFSGLGMRLEGFGSGNGDSETIERAIAANNWFARDGIISAVGNIRRHMLTEDALRSWTAGYDTVRDPKNVAVIMAGNIPLVGFFDMLCVLISGHRFHYKASSKDSVLTGYILSLLRETDPSLPIFAIAGDTIPDAVIATGSDNTNRYFRSRYGSIPAIFRGSRSSVGILLGDETPGELEGLASDILAYSGLGCRNVSHLIVPRGYDFDALTQALDNYTGVNPKYMNNYRQRTAFLEVESRPFIRGPFYVLREDTDFPSYISEITWHEAPNEAAIRNWLDVHETEIQCVAGSYRHPRSVPFGQTQSPGLTDYPDAVDTMAFLAKL